MRATLPLQTHTSIYLMHREATLGSRKWNHAHHPLSRPPSKLFVTLAFLVTLSFALQNQH